MSPVIEIKLDIDVREITRIGDSITLIPDVNFVNRSLSPQGVQEDMSTAFNNSLYSFSNNSIECTPVPLQQLYSDTFAWLIIIVYGCILLVGMIGNILTCMVVFIHKTMRRSIHFYMLNLALSDSLILLIYIPTQTKLISDQLSWSMGTLLCSTIHCIVHVCLSASIGTLIAICIDRYSGVRDPFTWRIRSRRNAWITIPLIWAVSIGIRFPMMYYTRLSARKRGECICEWPISPMKTAYITTMMSIQYILPIIFIAGVYIHIVWIISHGRESINSLHRRMVKMVIMLLLTYLICSGMQYIEFYLEVFNGFPQFTGWPYLYIFANLALTLQAAINPLIYSTIRDDFKQAFKSVITACAFKAVKIGLNSQESPQELTMFKMGSDTESEHVSESYLCPHSTSTSTLRKISAYSAMNKRSFPSSTGKKSLSQKFERQEDLGQLSDNYDSNDEEEEIELPTEDQILRWRMNRSETLAFVELEKFREQVKVKKMSRKESKLAARKCSIDYEDNSRINLSRKTSRFVTKAMFPINIILGPASSRSINETDVNGYTRKESTRSFAAPEKTINSRRSTRFASQALPPVNFRLGRRSRSREERKVHKLSNHSYDSRENSSLSVRKDSTRYSRNTNNSVYSRDSVDSRNKPFEPGDDDVKPSRTLGLNNSDKGRKNSVSRNVDSVVKKRRRKVAIQLPYFSLKRIKPRSSRKISRALSLSENKLHTCEPLREVDELSLKPKGSYDSLLEKAATELTELRPLSKAISIDDVTWEKSRLTTKPAIQKKIENAGSYQFLKFLRNRRNSRVLSMLFKSQESPV